MTAAMDEKDVSIPFDVAGIDDFTGVATGETIGQQAAVLGAADLTDFNNAMADIKRRAEAAKKVQATANWTAVACREGGIGAQGANRKDPGCTVILSGGSAGAGTVLPPPNSGKSAQSLPETPAKPMSSPGGTGKSETALLPENYGDASLFHKVGGGDGLLILPGRGVYSAKALLTAAERDGGKKSEMVFSRPPLPILDWDENLAIPVAEGDAGSCRTFGANPQVLVQPPARFHVSVAVAVKTVVVAIALTVEVTPVRASFGRTGLCWQGICSREEITGLVFSTVRVHFTLRATGAIKIGKWVIGGANIAFSTDISVPRQTNYTLTTG